MQIAYLILAHGDPLHLRRLIARLSTENAVVFVHVDKKSNLDLFQNLKSERVIFVENRVAVYWGDFSQVEAILTLIDAALTSNFDVKRLVLLSGADYPIRSITDIETFFAARLKTEFLNAVRMPADAAGKPIARLNNFVIRPGQSKFMHVLKRACRKFGLLPKQRNHATYLKELVPFGGSTWWAITREAAEYVSSFVKTRPDIVNFFKNVEYPDEAFFQTILMNSKFSENVSRNLTYTDWRSGGSSPRMIDESHLPEFAAGISFGSGDTYGDGPALFARKFKDGQDELLERIDRIERASENVMSVEEGSR